MNYDDSEELDRLQKRLATLNTVLQMCAVAIGLTLLFDGIFHFKFGETWGFAPLMFPLILFALLLAYCLLAKAMVRHKIKSIGDGLRVL